MLSKNKSWFGVKVKNAQKKILKFGLSELSNFLHIKLQI